MCGLTVHHTFELPFIAFVSEQPLGKFPLNVTLRMVDKEN